MARSGCPPDVLDGPSPKLQRSSPADHPRREPEMSLAPFHNHVEFPVVGQFEIQTDPLPSSRGTCYRDACGNWMNQFNSQASVPWSMILTDATSSPIELHFHSPARHRRPVPCSRRAYSCRARCKMAVLCTVTPLHSLLPARSSPAAPSQMNHAALVQDH
jgi:hypothetical protein